MPPAPPVITATCPSRLMLASEVGHAPAVRVSRAPGRWSDAAVRSAAGRAVPARGRRQCAATCEHLRSAGLRSDQRDASVCARTCPRRSAVTTCTADSWRSFRAAVRPNSTSAELATCDDIAPPQAAAELGAADHRAHQEPKWGHSPKSWGNGGNIPLFPGLGECVGMGGMPILPLK